MKLILSILLSIILSSAAFASEAVEKAAAGGDGGDGDTGADTTSLSAPEEFYLTFKYNGLINSLLTCYYMDEKVYIPLNQVFDLLQINNKAEGNSVKGYFLFDKNEYEISAGDKKFSYGGNEYSLSKKDFIVSENSIYIMPEKLRTGFNLDFMVDMESLELKLNTDEVLPIVANAKRTKVRNMLKEQEEEAVDAPLLFERRKNLFNGEFIDYFLSTNYAEKIKPSHNYNISTGNELLGGDLFLNFTGSISSGNSHNRTDASWRYVFNDNKLINQFSVGTTLPSTGILSGNYMGVSLTNAPFQQENNFGKYLLVDRTKPLSDVELYLNNELADYVKADEFGNYKFEIPLSYGSNNVELKIYSPDGELIESNRRLQIPFEFLRQSEFRYSVNAGEKTDTKDMMYGANVSYGVTSWLTNKAGFDLVNNDTYSKPVFFNSLSARLSSEYLVNLTSAPELFHQLSFNASYYSMHSFSVKYTRYKSNKLYNVRDLKEDVQVSASLPLTFINPRYSIQATGVYEKAPNLNNYKFNLGANFSFFDINPSLNYVFDESRYNNTSNIKKEFSFGFNTPVFFLNSLFPYFEGKYFNSSFKYDVDSRQLSSYKITYSSNISPECRLEMNYNNDLIGQFSAVNLLFKYEFPFTTTNVTASRNSFSANIHGTLGFDGSEKSIFFSKRNSVGTSAIAFRMYYDENNNGVYDTEEVILDDVNLNFDENVSYQRKENGVLLASELNPYYRYVVKVKDLSPKNPYLVPKHMAFTLETDPNQVKLIDVPFYFSHEIYGNVIAEKNDKSIPLPDMKVIVKDKNTGKAVPINTFNDGTLYHLGFLPGKYTAYVDPAQVEMLGAVSNPEKIDFEITEDNNSSAQLDFLLKIGGGSIEENPGIDLTEFREKFVETEKRINSKTGTPEEAHKTHFDYVEASEHKALPEFYERYLDMKEKLANWIVEEPVEEEKGDYTVVKGDCLWKIAGMKKHYGNAHLWPAIWEGNKDGIVNAPPGVKTTIPNPNLIYPGQVIRIPRLSEKDKEDYLSKEGEYTAIARSKRLKR